MIRGEIWLARLPITGNSIQGGLRPVILVSNNMALYHSPVFQVIPLTSRRKNNLPTHVELGSGCGLATPSTALCEQSMLITKELLIKKIGNCDKGTVDRINKSIMIQFGLLDTRREAVGIA